LSAFTLLLAIVAHIRLKDIHARLAASLAGLGIGLAIPCLPVMALALPFYAYSLYALAKTRPTLAWVAPITACAICFVVFTAWMVRN
jgi:hypothetical protein